MSALEVAGSLPLLRYWVARVFWRLDPFFREELVAETALELVRRHRRQPEKLFSKWTLLDYATREAYRRVKRNSGSFLDSGAEPLALAIPPNQHDGERLRERIADELVEDALEEFARESPSECRARDRTTREALGSSPDPLCIRWPKRLSGARASVLF